MDGDDEYEYKYDDENDKNLEQEREFVVRGAKALMPQAWPQPETAFQM